MATVVASASAISSHSTAQHAPDEDLFNDSLSFSNNNVLERRRAQIPHSADEGLETRNRRISSGHISLDGNGQRQGQRGEGPVLTEMMESPPILEEAITDPLNSSVGATSTTYEEGTPPIQVTEYSSVAMDSPTIYGKHLQGAGPSSPGEERLKRRLRFFFLNPVQKWAATRRFPFKLFIQITKIFLVTVQVTILLSTFSQVQANPSFLLVVFVRFVSRQSRLLCQKHGGGLFTHLPARLDSGFGRD